jgi:hypothetical protein
MTINNDQAVNTQRFNRTARHGSLNFQYFKNLVQNNPDPEKILDFLNKYLQSNIFEKDVFSKLILFSIVKIRPTNPELNKRLLELAESRLDSTEVEKFRKLIPKPPSLYPNLPSPSQSYTPQPFYSSYPGIAKGQSPHVGGYRKRKTRYQKQLIKRKTQKKRRSRR